MVDVIEIDTRFVEAVADGDRGKSRPMFDPPESLLLGCRDELAVDENACGGVSVVRVDAEDDHGCGTDTLVCASPIMAGPQ